MLRDISPDLELCGSATRLHVADKLELIWDARLSCLKGPPSYRDESNSDSVRPFLSNRKNVLHRDAREIDGKVQEEK